MNLGRLVSQQYNRWMFISGAAALAYELVVQKILTYVLGVSLTSASISVAAYMLGFAIGGALAAVTVDRLRRPLAVYAVMELLIGAAIVGILLGYDWFSSGLMYQLDDHPTLRAVFADVRLRLPFSLLLLLPLTIPMGLTFPLLARSLLTAGKETPASAAGQKGHSPSLNELYWANLAGAIAGACLSPYLVLPHLGIAVLAGIGVCGNVYIAVGALRLGRRLEPLAAGARVGLGPEDLSSPPAVVPAFGKGATCSLSFLSGLVLFSLEVIWMHLLATVIGNSAFAFANMLGAVLIALALAARTESREATRPEGPTPLGRLVANGALALALTIPLYPLGGFVFSFFGIFDPGFYSREAVRLAVAGLAIIPSGYFISRIFPRLILGVSGGAGTVGHSLGWLYVWNTLGSLAGIFGARYLLIPGPGSAASFRLLALLLLAAAWWIASREAAPGATSLGLRERLSLLTPGRRALAAGALLAFALPSWRTDWLVSGRNIYFAADPTVQPGTVQYYREDPEAGHITVSRLSNGNVQLRSNGKFEGSDGSEMLAQLSFGILPSLAARNLERGFVIGLGSGVTARAMGMFPFKELEIVELSQGIIDATSRYFGEANRHILDDQRVSLQHDDGRHALLLSDRKYDVVASELSSIWFAGVGNLYGREFYEIVRSRLAPGGVLLQWVQMHHIRLVDLWTVLNTVREVFPHVALWYSGGQIQVMASMEKISLDWGRARELFDNERILQNEFERFSVMRSLGSILLDEASLDALLAWPGYAGIPETLAAFRQLLYVSSDLHPFLEYNTPRGNALDWAETFNAAMLRGFSKGGCRLPLRNLPAGDRGFAAALVNLTSGQDAAAALLWSQLPEASRGSFADSFAKLFARSDRLEVIEEVRTPALP